MRYLKVAKDHLYYYQRVWPKKLQNTAKTLGFGRVMVKPLGLSKPTASDLDIARELEKWNSVYETVCESMTTEAVTDELVRRRAAALLEARGYAPGILSSLDPNDEAYFAVIDSVVDADPSWRFHPDGRPKSEHERKHPLGEAVVDQMLELLTNPTLAERILISEACNNYLKKRQTAITERQYRKEEKQLQQFIKVVGDAPLTTEAAAVKLRSYRNHLFAADYKGPTVARYLAGPRAALAYAADTVATDVVIPEITVKGSTDHQDRYALSEKEMQQLIRLAMDHGSGLREYVRLFYILAIHCGGHGAEIRKTMTTDFDYDSDAEMHYLRIRGGKTDYRDRIVPILDPFVPYVQMLMPLSGSMMDDAGDVTESAISAALTKPIKQLINKKATAYSIRHGFRSLAIARQIPTDLQAQLCGWRDQSVSQHQQRYGLAGQAFVENMVAKRDALQRMLTPML